METENKDLKSKGGRPPKKTGLPETSKLIRKIFENFAIYRYGHCQLDRNHLLMNSHQVKGAMIALHAILTNSKMVKDYLLTQKDQEILDWSRVKTQFIKVV